MRLPAPAARAPPSPFLRLPQQQQGTPLEALAMAATAPRQALGAESLGLQVPAAALPQEGSIGIAAGLQMLQSGTPAPSQRPGKPSSGSSGVLVASGSGSGSGPGFSSGSGRGLGFSSSSGTGSGGGHGTGSSSGQPDDPLEALAAVEGGAPDWLLPPESIRLCTQDGGGSLVALGRGAFGNVSPSRAIKMRLQGRVKDGCCIRSCPLLH